MSECDTNAHLNVNLTLSWLKTVQAFLKVTVCFVKVKISSFNPAFVVPEEHLESLKEHFHRC